MVLPGLVGPSYRSLSRNVDPAECINWFVESVDDVNARNPAVLYPTPGFTAFATVAPGPIRALFENPDDGRVFCVSGYILYELDNAGTPTNRGTVAIDSNPATICSNGAAGGQLFITSGGVGYNYDLGTDALSTVLSSGATMGAYISNVFVSLNTATSTFRLSALNDGTSWPAAQFAQRSLAGDPWVSMAVMNSEIWLLGDTTSEVWSDQGLFPFPFAPIPGALFNQGCSAPYSVGVADSVLVWVNHSTQGDGMVLRSNGYNASRLSTHPVEVALQGYANLGDAQAFVYQENGHTFWVCNFEDGGRSWAWDTTTNLWHERGYWNTTSSAWEALRVGTHAHGFTGVHLVGDRSAGVVYLQKASTATDVDAAGIRRLRVFRGLDAEQDYVFYSSLQLEMETGLGLVTGQGSDPQVMLQCSRDSGYTWTTERWVSAGKIGDYTARAQWLRLGRARNMVFRVVVSDPVEPWTLIRAVARAEQGVA